jgi:hypothetical protein
LLPSGLILIHSGSRNCVPPGHQNEMAIYDPAIDEFTVHFYSSVPSYFPEVWVNPSGTESLVVPVSGPGGYSPGYADQVIDLIRLQ